MSKKIYALLECISVLGGNISHGSQVLHPSQFDVSDTDRLNVFFEYPPIQQQNILKEVLLSFPEARKIFDEFQLLGEAQNFGKKWQIQIYVETSTDHFDINSIQKIVGDDGEVSYSSQKTTEDLLSEQLTDFLGEGGNPLRPQTRMVINMETSDLSKIGGVKKYFPRNLVKISVCNEQIRRLDKIETDLLDLKTDLLSKCAQAWNRKIKERAVDYLETTRHLRAFQTCVTDLMTRINACTQYLEQNNNKQEDLEHRIEVLDDILGEINPYLV